MEGWHDEETLLGRDAIGLLAGGVEIIAEFHQLRPEGAHGRVLLHRVAARDIDLRGQPRRRRGPGLALPVIAARGRADTAHLGMGVPEPVDEGQRAAHLERTRGRVVLVLDPDLGAQALGQKRPGVLRGGRHVCRHKPVCGGKIVGGELHGVLLRAGPLTLPGRPPACKPGRTGLASIGRHGQGDRDDRSHHRREPGHRRGAGRRLPGPRRASRRGGPLGHRHTPRCQRPGLDPRAGGWACGPGHRPAGLQRRHLPRQGHGRRGRVRRRHMGRDLRGET